MPKLTDSSIAIGKGVNQFKFVIEYTTFIKHIDVAVTGPVKDFTDHPRYVLRMGSEEEYITIFIYNPIRT